MGKSVQVHKPHKSRFSSKSSRHLHRVSQTEKVRTGKEQKSLKGARAARVQHNKMVRDNKRAALMKEKRVSSGASSPPRVIMLFGLSEKVNINSIKNEILALLAPDRHKCASTVASPRNKIRVTILEAPHGDILSCMEMAKVADLIAFVASGNSILEGSEASNIIDSFGSRCLSVFRALGFPSTAVLIRDLPTLLKQRQEVKKICASTLGCELPENCKYYMADIKEDLHKFMWLFKEQHVSSPHWRQQRPYLFSEKVDAEHEDGIGNCYLLLSGYVRAHAFSVNQLVHVSGAGDFQLAKIDILKDPVPLNDGKNTESMDSDDLYIEQVVRTLLPEGTKLQPLLVENVPDPLAGEQTWPTEAEMVEADAANKAKKLKKRRLPRGTSDYQAAWIVDDTDDENSDYDDDHGDGMIIDDDKNGYLGHGAVGLSDIDDESYSLKDMDAKAETDTDMMDDENWTQEQMEAEIERIKKAHSEDEEFPDEVDTPLDVPARKRFAKYRGLKSFRTSSWDPKESLPAEYARIFAFDNFSRTQKHVLQNVLKTDLGNMDEVVPVGSYVKLYIKQVPVDVASKLTTLSKKSPIIASGLIQHESKMSVLHFSLRKHDSYEAPIKSKETLTFHLGFRQFIARPIYSTDNLNSDKHKMERFLHPGRFTMASVYGPISFPPLPLIALKAGQGPPAIAATGSLRSADPDRMIVKKIILTGYPQRVSKLKATVRFMFHNPEDVRWFKPVELWTKFGRRGRVKEPVGTHGAMKCIFNGVVQQHDSVCMSLYKRAYPKWPENKYALLDQYC